ncbi:MAG: hypothetical protein V1495_05995 [Pseudomonadota bacterium]
MKRTIAMFLVIGMAGLPFPAYADPFELRESSYDWARVIRVEPLIRQVDLWSPEEECRDREVQVIHEGGGRSVAGSAIAGGLIGGAFGALLGRGHARPATTVGGAALGAFIGGSSADRANRRSSNEEVRNVRECRTINHSRTEERIDGYYVDYEYRGEIYHAHLPYRPDNRIRVRVTVDPMAP